MKEASEIHPSRNNGLPMRHAKGAHALGSSTSRGLDPDPWGESREEGLLEYWQIFRRQKGFLVLFSFLGGILGLLVSLPQTPLYQAQTVLEIQGLNEEFLNIKDLNPTTAGGGAFAPSDIVSQINILQSRSLLEKVSKKLGFEKAFDRDPRTGRLSAWQKALGLPGPDTLSSRERMLELMAQSLKVTVAGDSRIVEILAESSDPQLAADFANTLAEEFIQQNMEARWQGTQRTEKWLDHQLEELRVKLEKSEERLQQYARVSGLMFNSQHESVAEERLRQLQEELSRAQADRIAKQSRYQLLSTRDSDSLPGALSESPLAAYRIKLTDLRRQLAELSATYTPAHYKVKRLEAQIRELEAATRKEQANIAGRTQSDYEAALERENLLARDYGRQAKLVSELAAKSIQYNIFNREVETNRQLYDSLLQKVKEAGVASAMSASNIPGC